ncbi:MAG: aldehyde dehydrogenase family protein, partial [Spirochaetales bacterium]
MDIIKITIQKQRDFFNSKSTLDIDFRKSQLQKLYAEIKKNEREILNAVKKDLNKSAFEGYLSEIGMVYEEINFMIKNIKKLSKPQKHKTPLMHFPSTTHTYCDPFGCVLIMSPWNYPFNLTISPL